MDRRTFFKMAGAGAGTLLVLPKITPFIAEPEPEPIPEKPPTVASEPVIHRTPGYIYRENTQIAAVANCGVEMYRPIHEISSLHDNGFKEFDVSGPMEVKMYGDLFPLDNIEPMTLMNDEKTLSIILYMPDGDSCIEAQGIITQIGLDCSMDSKEIRSFVFEVIGDTHINCLT